MAGITRSASPCRRWPCCSCSRQATTRRPCSHRSFHVAPHLPREGRCRAVIERVAPEVDGGRYAAKRVAGDTVVVEADVFTDGHDQVACVVRYRRADAPDWLEAP